MFNKIDESAFDLDLGVFTTWNSYDTVEYNKDTQD